jgi:hypothetical protein
MTVPSATQGTEAQGVPRAKRERITDKDPAVKLARKRLSVLELAAELGSVTKACK